MQAMKRSRRRPPYRQDGSTNFPARNRAGCYMIFDGSPTVPAYVGYGAADVYKALYRHFQSWDDPTHTRAVYPKHGDRITVRVIYTRTAAQAERLERALIVKHRPKGNPNKMKSLDFDGDMKAIIAMAEDAPFIASNEPAPF